MKKGDKITVWGVGFGFQRGTVRSHREGRITYEWGESQRFVGGRVSFAGIETVAYADRGLLWAWGWKGREVDALKAAVALR